MNRLPDIILVLSDQHRGQALSSAGDANVNTPVLDALGAEGISFARAYANCPICTPSRGTIFSGRHAHCGAVQSFFDVYKPAAPSLATELRALGYRTAYFGKWHLGVVRDQVPPPLRRAGDGYANAPYRTPERFRAGFQDWAAFEVGGAHFDTHVYRDGDLTPTLLPGYQCDSLTDLAVDYLRDYRREEPLFMVVSPLTPHFPLEIPPEGMPRDPSSLALRPNVHADPSNSHTVERQADFGERYARYCAMIENLDRNIGRLAQSLRSSPRFSRSLLAYLSDHGEFMGSHGRIERKEHPHEESVRIPAIFNQPGAIPAIGTDNSCLFSLVDFFPTLLGHIGASIPAYCQGTDCAPRLRGAAFRGPDLALLEMVGSPRWILDMPDWRGFVDERWKYAYYETGEELLFDLRDDPYEMENLAETDGERTRRNRFRLKELLARSREPYFDVLMDHGSRWDGPRVDVSAQ